MAASPDAADFSAEELAHRWSLVIPHRDRALRVARARTRSPHDAEDLATEALLRAVHMPTLRESSVGGLVSTITMRLAIDLHRREVLARRLERRWTVDLAAEEVGAGLCDRSEASWLAAQLSSLKPNEREVVLHRAAGHSVSSTAQALGITYKAVDSAFTRARGRLRHLWEATLAAILIAAGALRKSIRSQPAMLSAQATAMLALVAVIPAVDHATFAPNVGRSFAIAPSVEAATPRNTGPAGGLGRPSPLPVHRFANGNSREQGSARRLVKTGPVGDRRVVQAGAGVEQRDTDRTFAEEVEDCITYGVIVSPNQIDCRTA